MKKIIILLVFGLSMIGCEKEYCRVCDTIMKNPAGIIHYQTIDCNGVEKEGINYIVYTGSELTYFMITTCNDTLL